MQEIGRKLGKSESSGHAENSRHRHTENHQHRKHTGHTGNKKILILLLASLLILGTSGCKKDEDVEKIDYEVSAIVEYSGSTWEIRKTNESSLLKIYKDNEFMSDTTKEYAVKPLLEIPKVLGDTQVNLSNYKLLAENTYEIKLADSMKYVNQLIEDGYTEEYKAVTYKFIEYYLKNKEGSYDRLIITPEYLVIGSTNEIKDPDMLDYTFE